MFKREMKQKIIDLSIEHSIVTQFTSFVAVEEREKVSECKPDTMFSKATSPSAAGPTWRTNRQLISMNSIFIHMMIIVRLLFLTG